MNNSYSNSSDEFPCNHSIDIVFWILNGLTGLVVISGNLLSCLVFASSQYLRQSCMNIFLLSLSIADLMVGFLVLPGYSAFCDGCKYSWSRYCNILSPLKDFALSAVILNLLAVSHDRYTAVFRPLHYNSRMNPMSVGIILGAVWCTPIVLAGIRFLIYFLLKKTATHTAVIFYNLSLSVFLVIIPITILIIVNIMLTRAVKRQRTRVHVLQSEMYSEIASVTVIKKRAFESSHKRRKGTLSCVMVVVLFILCWFPRASFHIWISANRNKPVNPVFSKITLFLLAVQSSVNPFIYSIYRNEFRKAAKKVLFCLVVCRKAQYV